jgi:hypothetical protein
MKWTVKLAPRSGVNELIQRIVSIPAIIWVVEQVGNISPDNGKILAELSNHQRGSHAGQPVWLPQPALPVANFLQDPHYGSRFRHIELVKVR